MTVKTDRRTQLRKRPLSLVYVELPPANGGMMRDLSEQGFSLRAMMPLRPSEKIPFSFSLDSTARIDGEAIVFRVDDGGHVAALEFAGIAGHSRDQIRRWLEKFDEPILPEPEPEQDDSSKRTSLTELRSRIRGRKPDSTDPPAPAKKITAAPKPEPPLTMDSPEAKIVPPTAVVTPLIPEPSPEPVSPALEGLTPPPAIDAEEYTPGPPPPPLAEIEQPVSSPPQTMMALPGPVRELSPEPSSPAEAVAPPGIEELEAPDLPPLLKLSSVRPGVASAEISPEHLAPEAKPIAPAEPPEKIQIALPTAESSVAAETQVPGPAPAARTPHGVPWRRTPPALEPLSSIEREADSNTPGWMDRFTLGRAIGIMLFLTLLAGSYVYHRELGLAIIWFGHQIAGDETPEISHAIRPEIPSVSHATPPSAPAPRVVEPPAASAQKSPETTEAKSANLPAASDTTPTPQVKNATPETLVPLAQVTRQPSPGPAPAPAADNSVEAGQQEYLEALQILRSPGRAVEVPAAVQLLWTSVEKGNTAAEIALAELFRTGKGVTKNCDQTRILLSAAARRGNGEARKRLEAFQREGCRN
ncbi:MAG TPA: PilZ domain-containing protein [Candidatus Acidoferrum sp.]|nr:PilZ domain-containing protein [Candidatus Acidoferrum sp.]